MAGSGPALARSPQGSSIGSPGRDLVEARQLLVTARAVLDGRTSLPARRRTRAAALFARTALERIIDARLTTARLDLADASMRVKLICLRIKLDASDADDATIAWAGLSRGCHQHAYELAPAWAEVTHLITLVEGLGQPA